MKQPFVATHQYTILQDHHLSMLCSLSDKTKRGSGGRKFSCKHKILIAGEFVMHLASNVANYK